MQTTYNLPDSLQQDLDRFQQETERFKSGESSATQFRVFRVPQGVYEQREEGAFMLRIRLPAGGILPHQMRTVADVSRTYGNGILHVTTRQDIQAHEVPLDNIHPALVRLYGAGLSTKGGGGNTVRNITACCDAGVCEREAFDVSPYAAALTEFLLADPLSFQLPRKYKIAFAGCPTDCIGATVNDVGFIAKRNGEAGFSVHVAGGMGAYSRVADPLEEFVPADQVSHVAEAVKRVFDKHGNRKNRHKARLRFLLDSIGIDRFRELYDAELAELKARGLAALAPRELPRTDRAAPTQMAPAANGFEDWRGRNTMPQRQEGYYLVEIPLLLGDIPADVLERLADVAEAFGEGMLRTTQWQNAVIRWVHENELTGLHAALVGLGLAATPAPILRNTIACAGASTCKLGICLSRGLARAVTDKLASDGLDLDELGDLNLHISGCPNSCGRHPVGRIGLFGAARRVGDRLVPHYVVQLGGSVVEGATRLAEGKTAVPARNVPGFLADFLRAFRDSEQHPDFDAFVGAAGQRVVKQLAERHGRVPSWDEDKNYYFDWDADVPFSLEGRGPGECSAGMLDLIEVDLASAQEAVEQGDLRNATVLAARSLLITRGAQARDDADALRLFRKHFLDEGLADASFGGLIDAALASESADLQAEEVSAFVTGVQALFDNMDASLRFTPKPAAEPAAADGPPSAPGPDVEVAREADLSGVTCPMNYVKTKMLLEQVASGEVVSVLLDKEGARNCPTSAQDDGHEVISCDQVGSQWRLLVRKK